MSNRKRKSKIFSQVGSSSLRLVIKRLMLINFVTIWHARSVCVCVFLGLWVRNDETGLSAVMMIRSMICILNNEICRILNDRVFAKTTNIKRIRSDFFCSISSKLFKTLTINFYYATAVNDEPKEIFAEFSLNSVV